MPANMAYFGGYELGKWVMPGAWVLGALQTPCLSVGAGMGGAYTASPARAHSPTLWTALLPLTHAQRARAWLAAWWQGPARS